MNLKLLFLCLFIFPLVLFGQFHYSFEIQIDLIVIQQLKNNEWNPIDTLEGNDCTIFGNKIYTLSKVNFFTSSPYSLVFNYYLIEDGKINLINSFILHSSMETIQVNFELEGRYLKITSKKSLTSKGVKPHGILQPFSIDEMRGRKKTLNFLLKFENFNLLEKTLVKFNDW